MGRSVRLLGVIAAAAFAIGCLGPGTTRAPRMFVLDPVLTAAETPDPDVSVGVGPVSLPERLDRPQILSRSGEHEVSIAEFEQWAEPLEDGFTRVLADNLSQAVGTDRVYLYPWGRAIPIDVQVEVDVSRFESEPGGGITLAARWRLIGPGSRELSPKRATRYHEATAAATPEARVDAMSRALAALSGDIARAIAEIRSR